MLNGPDRNATAELSSEELRLRQEGDFFVVFFQLNGGSCSMVLYMRQEKAEAKVREMGDLLHQGRSLHVGQHEITQHNCEGVVLMKYQSVISRSFVSNN